MTPIEIVVCSTAGAALIGCATQPEPSENLGLFDKDLLWLWILVGLTVVGLFFRSFRDEFLTGLAPIVQTLVVQLTYLIIFFLLVLVVLPWSCDHIFGKKSGPPQDKSAQADGR